MIYIKLLSVCALVVTTKAIQCQQITNLRFNPDNYQLQTLSFEDKTFQVRAFEEIVFVSQPVDTTYEIMNIYIPEEYFQGKKINGYTVETAPIFFPNKIGGYLPAKPVYTKHKSNGDRSQFNGGISPAKVKKNDGVFPDGGVIGMDGFASQSNSVLVALSKGYVVASAGARGRSTKDTESKYTGKAPAGIVDLKAAIRYLKYNDNVMPGDASKIISNGTSAGGAMSALLGATGNNPDYNLYLKSLGAADTTDDVFAVSAYCPITNLENADMAYEWQFNGINTFKPGGPKLNNSSQPLPLNDDQITISSQLKQLFPEYINSLNLKNKSGALLFLDAGGNGNFKELVKTYIIASAQKELDKGTDLSKFKFLTIKNKKVTQVDFNGYISYLERQKTPPAFDALDLSTAENMLFGSPKTDKRHFTSFGQTHSTVDATSADRLTVKMMNPMNYIGQEKTTTAKYWRIRHGSKDKDTGLAIPVLLATLLQNKGYNVDFAIPWEKTHSGDYDLDELFNWMDTICK